MTDEQKRKLLAYHDRIISSLSQLELEDYSYLLELLISELEAEALER